MSREVQITFDAADPVALSRFWAEALHAILQPPPHRELAPGEDPIAAWNEFLERSGVPENQRGSASAVIDPDGRHPRLYFQRVPEPKTAKNRVHLDLRVAPGLEGAERMRALEVEADRLVSLGATRLARHDPDPPMSAGFLVLTDPEGNEFCLD